MNPALEDIATRLAGEAVEVRNPVPDDVDATDWQPSDEDVRAMQSAGLVLLNGAHFSKWTRRVTLSDDVLVDTSRGFRDEYIAVEDFSVHTHGSEGEHSHPGTAPNTYLDPALAILQATAVRDALVGLVPAERESIDERHRELVGELRAIDEEYDEVLRGAEPTPMFASHPFCNYLGRRAKWEIEHLHWRPDVMPGDDRWDRVEERIIDHPAVWMLWDRPPLPEIEERLVELGIVSVVLDSGVRRLGDRDLAGVLRANLGAVQRIVNRDRSAIARE